MFIQGEAVGNLNLNMQMNYTYCIIKKIASVILFEKKRAEILNKNRALMSEELNKKQTNEKTTSFSGVLTSNYLFCRKYTKLLIWLFLM